MTMIIQDGAYDINKPCVLYENVFLTGTLTASSGTGEDAISGTTWDFWTGAGASTLEIDIGVSTEVDCLFIDAHNLATVSSNLTFDKWDGAAWVNVETITPTSDVAIMLVMPNLSATKYRIGATGASIGVVMLGKRLVFPQGVDQSHTSIQHARVYELLGGNSLGGQFTGQKVIRKSADVGVTFPLLDAAWVDSDMSDFELHYNTGQPFAFAARPKDFPDDFGYCQRPDNAGELRPRYYEGGMYEEFTMSIGVYVNV
tara:strand:- start:358 stop:1128 length:771 start_codon:yes stop_codon:yes gene_type:complete